MRELGRLELWQSLLESPTFWSEVVYRGFWVVAGFCLMFFCLLRIGRRRRWDRRPGLLKDESGNWTVEFVLIAPLITIFFVIFGQMTILMRTALVVHYSAYNAARSARVHMPSICGGIEKIKSGAAENCGSISQVIDALNLKSATPRPVSGNYEEIALWAAQKTLVSASPVNNDLGCSDAGCELPDYFKNMPFQARLKNNSLKEANEQRARYAYDKYNTDLRVFIGEFSVDDFRGLHQSGSIDSLANIASVGPELALFNGNNDDEDLGYPVTAELTFKANVMFPYFNHWNYGSCETVEGLFGSLCANFKTKKGRKRFYTNITAKVTVY